MAGLIPIKIFLVLPIVWTCASRVCYSSQRNCVSLTIDAKLRFTPNAYAAPTNKEPTGHFLAPLKLAVLACLLCLQLTALNPEWKLSQYAHSAWRVQDGAFNGFPWAIAQTTDGYIWAGTSSGLLRFDGVRFAPEAVTGDERLASARIFALLGASDGSLWIGAAQGNIWR